MTYTWYPGRRKIVGPVTEFVRKAHKKCIIDTLRELQPPIKKDKKTGFQKTLICPICKGTCERIDAKTGQLRKCVLCDNGRVENYKHKNRTED